MIVELPQGPVSTLLECARHVQSVNVQSKNTASVSYLLNSMSEVLPIIYNSDYIFLRTNRNTRFSTLERLYYLAHLVEHIRYLERRIRQEYTGLDALEMNKISRSIRELYESYLTIEETVRELTGKHLRGIEEGLYICNQPAFTCNTGDDTPRCSE